MQFIKTNTQNCVFTVYFCHIGCGIGLLCRLCNLYTALHTDIYMDKGIHFCTQIYTLFWSQIYTLFRTHYCTSLRSALQASQCSASCALTHAVFHVMRLLTETCLLERAVCDRAGPSP
ncbi:hypothetical protein FKM82_014407 [Ascaphus truei]